MIYFRDDRLTIRNLTEEDVPAIVTAEQALGWHVTAEKYLTRLRDKASGLSIMLAAVWQEQVAGYVNLYLYDASHNSKDPPEIVDFGVLLKFRRQGIGTALMNVAEQLASKHSSRVSLFVGLHAGYGPAQRMYIKRGYLPDGQGVYYRDRLLAPYAECRNDDDLVLRLVKDLT